MRLLEKRGRLGSGLTVISACSPRTTKPVRRTNERDFVMGFDGVEPALASKFDAEGKLPNLKKLAESRTHRTLGTTQLLRRRGL
ncbi:MAG: hypothetical protein ABI672_08025 [Vicinamibacteria bacterium]